MWNICGHRLNVGEKRQVIIEPNVEGYEIPTTLICGKEQGKTLLVTAGIHSGEYPGVPAVIRLAKELDPENIKGKIILMHCVNTSGFWKRSPGMIPEDGFNLNGDYPGKADGTTGERIADYFIQNLFPNVDFILDLHSGGPTEPMTPCLFFPNKETVREEAVAAAKALDVPYLLASTAYKGEYSYAANYFDVPGLLVERGYCGCCKEEWIQAYHKDIRLLMDHLNICKMDGEKAIYKKKIYEKTIYLTANESGLWYPYIREDQKVTAGQALGRIEDFWGNLIAEYFAQEDGRVFYYTSGLAVTPGFPLVAYGIEESSRCC